MKIKIQVKTPKGEAEKAEKKLRFFLLGRFDKPVETYINKDDSIFYWSVETTIKRVLEIQKNVARFQMITGWIVEKKAFQKLADSPEDIEKIKKMFKDTKVTIIKNATAEEVQENNKTFWQNIKEKFKRKEE